MAALSCTLLVDVDAPTNYLNQALLRRMTVTGYVLVATHGQEALDVAPGPDSARHENAARERPGVSADVRIVPACRAPRRGQHPFHHLAESLDVARIQRLPIAGYLTKPLTLEKVDGIFHEHFSLPPAAG
ncbi:hypothetical protein F0P96_17200 [Hymenobacter busanensis]|uniref:Uncharacterized protein n=1 Tax=Hymenobacter busanensis TaxID=2607656 RepID=A0A7L4ZSP5_9BACT|nr:hypothetical protein [Hymenobacter busanensis]KAA9327712.1 hypothetical protein F0P96_17200 [Hymenobacter busanensis]QHJ05947.1 hypothetical protein GUY19_01025 [Hymenobacter busanensis]